MVSLRGIADDADDVAHKLIAIGSTIEQGCDLLVNVARNQPRAGVGRAFSRNVERPQPVRNAFVAHELGNHHQQTQTDDHRQSFEEHLFLIVGRNRSGPNDRILDETIDAFLQLLMHICNGLQVQVFVRPSFTHTARQSLDAKPMRLEKPWLNLKPEPRIPGGMKIFRRLLHRKHEVRPVIHRP